MRRLFSWWLHAMITCMKVFFYFILSIAVAGGTYGLTFFTLYAGLFGPTNSTVFGVALVAGAGIYLYVLVTLFRKNKYAGRLSLLIVSIPVVYLFLSFSLAPSCHITANPPVISYGSSTMLSWTSNGSSAKWQNPMRSIFTRDNMNPPAGTPPANGSLIYTPQFEERPGGTAIPKITLHVYKLSIFKGSCDVDLKITPLNRE